jgi:NADH-quinone oxidoreductase subunit E
MTTDAHTEGPLHHLTPLRPSEEPYPPEVLEQLRADAAEIIARYPQKRSALLPLLHLVQSVDGYVTGRGVDFCAEELELTAAEVSGVATFYTQYKRHPNGEYTVGVCTNTLCAIMGGDQIFEELSEHLGVGHDETTPDGKITLERVECNAACDYAPVVMVNWEFFDQQTPESTRQLVDRLRAGEPVQPTRGPSRVCTFRQVSRVLAGFDDGLADEGPGAGPASLAGLKVARERGWEAPRAEGDADAAATGGPGASGEREGYTSTDTPANPPDELPGQGKVGGATEDGTKEADE